MLMLVKHAREAERAHHPRTWLEKRACAVLARRPAWANFSHEIAPPPGPALGVNSTRFLVRHCIFSKFREIAPVFKAMRER